VLRRIFGPNRDEVTRGCRELHSEVLRCLYSSPNIISMVKSRKMWRGGSCGAQAGDGPVCT
jgi:hypothetical protein